MSLLQHPIGRKTMVAQLVGFHALPRVTTSSPTPNHDTLFAEHRCFVMASLPTEYIYRDNLPAHKLRCAARHPSMQLASPSLGGCIEHAEPVAIQLRLLLAIKETPPTYIRR